MKKSETNFPICHQNKITTVFIQTCFITKKLKIAVLFGWKMGKFVSLFLHVVQKTRWFPENDTPPNPFRFWRKKTNGTDENQILLNVFFFPMQMSVSQQLVCFRSIVFFCLFLWGTIYVREIWCGQKLWILRKGNK